jgi:hypothetical protein
MVFKIWNSLQILLCNTFYNYIYYTLIGVHRIGLDVCYSFDTSIGRHFVSFDIYFLLLYIYFMAKYFNLNENFILLKDSSDRNSLSSDRISQFRIGF